MKWHLDQLVEIVCGNIARDAGALKMLLHRAVDEVVICRDHEGCTLEKQEQTDGFEGRNSGFRQAPIQVVNKYHQGDAKLFQYFFEC